MTEVGLTIQEKEKKEPLNVLLVEDEPHVANLIKVVLMEHNITDFTTAEEALEALRKSKKAGMSFDWIITDWGLAGNMDGFGLADSIKSEELGNPFVTMISGGAETIKGKKSMDQLRENGIHQLMGKPFPIRDLSDSADKVRDFGRETGNPQA